MLNSINTLVANPQNQFDLLKILLDKGALAVTTLFIGAIASIALERYKSALTKQQQLTNLTNPMITDLFSECEKLYDAGKAAIMEGALDFRPVEQWVDRLLEEPVDVSRRSMGDFAIDGASTLIRVRGREITIQTLLLNCSQNGRIESFVCSDSFWTDPEVIDGFGSFLGTLNDGIIPIHRCFVLSRRRQRYV